MRAACSSWAGVGAAPLGFPKPSAYHSVSWRSDAVTSPNCFIQMDIFFWVFCAFNFGSAYTPMVRIALKKHTTKNMKQLPIYPAQLQRQWRRWQLPRQDSWVWKWLKNRQNHIEWRDILRSQPLWQHKQPRMGCLYFLCSGSMSVRDIRNY